MDDETTCGCPAPRHGPTGCAEPGRPHPEDAEIVQACLNCGPWESVGLHLSDMRLDYSGTEMAEMDADRELVASETAGRGFWR